jgi:alpha-beta hydrolase superfamily lysophospholipase
MMKSLEGKFPGADGVRLFYRFYENPLDAGTLIISHGHGEHSGRYEKFSHSLADAGLSLAVFDMRGYGLSEGRDVYVDSFEEFLSDVTCFYDFLRQKHHCPEKIHFLGHSLGGLVAVHWALRFPDRIRALYLSSPFLGLCVPRWVAAINAFLNRVSPGFIYQNPVYPPHLTHNPEEVRNYKADMLIKRKISVRLIHEMLLYQAKLDRMEHFRFPFSVYVLAAGLEKVVDLKRTLSFFQRVESPRKEMKIFEGFYHEIFNELGQEKAFDFLKICIADAQKQS